MKAVRDLGGMKDRKVPVRQRTRETRDLTFLMRALFPRIRRWRKFSNAPEQRCHESEGWAGGFLPRTTPQPIQRGKRVRAMLDERPTLISTGGPSSRSRNFLGKEREYAKFLIHSRNAVRDKEVKKYAAETGGFDSRTFLGKGENQRAG